MPLHRRREPEPEPRDHHHDHDHDHDHHHRDRHHHHHHDRREREQDGPGVVAVRATLAAGAAPETIADLMRAFPAEQEAILITLHREAGNHFTAQVLEALDGSRPPTPRERPAPPPGDIDPPQPGPGPQPKPRLAENAWAEAEAYNRAHIHQVVVFDRATGGRFAKRNGELDAAGVAQWQREHGLPGDGRVTPETIAAASGKTPAPAPTPHPTPTPQPAPSQLPVSAEAQTIIMDYYGLDLGTHIVAADKDSVQAAATARAESWVQAEHCAEHAKKWVRRYDDGGFQSPQVEQLRHITRYQRPRHAEVTIQNNGGWYSSAVPAAGDAAAIGAAIDAEVKRLRAPFEQPAPAPAPPAPAPPAPPQTPAP